MHSFTNLNKSTLVQSPFLRCFVRFCVPLASQHAGSVHLSLFQHNSVTFISLTRLESTARSPTAIFRLGHKPKRTNKTKKKKNKKKLKCSLGAQPRRRPRRRPNEAAQDEHAQRDAEGDNMDVEPRRSPYAAAKKTKDNLRNPKANGSHAMFF